MPKDGFRKEANKLVKFSAMRILILGFLEVYQVSFFPPDGDAWEEREFPTCA
jgi:hypothetical protein